MDRDVLRAVVEAVVATARGPVTASSLAEALGEEDVTSEVIESELQELAATTDRDDRGVRFERAAGGWRLVTPPQLDPYLRAFHGVTARQRLSQAALEVLAIVAYRQPVTAPEVNFIRGVNSGGVLRTLLDRRLLRVAGRKEVVGKPFLYRTTKEFLVHFGLDGVGDLPDPEEVLGGEDEATAAD